MDLEKEAHEKIILLKKKEEKEVIAALKDNPKYFYSYAKKKSSTKCRIGPLHETGGNSETFTDDPKCMADILQNQFISVFSDPNKT